MTETKFFERIDRYSAWNLWRITPDGAVEVYDHSLHFWEPALDNLNDGSRFRPIDIDRAHFLQSIGL